VLCDETGGAAHVDGEEQLNHELDGLGVAGGGGGEGRHHEELIRGSLAHRPVPAQQHAVADEGLPGLVL